MFLLLKDYEILQQKFLWESLLTLSGHQGFFERTHILITDKYNLIRNLLLKILIHFTSLFGCNKCIFKIHLYLYISLHSLYFTIYRYWLLNMTYINARCLFWTLLSHRKNPVRIKKLVRIELHRNTNVISS